MLLLKKLSSDLKYECSLSGDIVGSQPPWVLEVTDKETEAQKDEATYPKATQQVSDRAWTHWPQSRLLP